MIRNHIFVVLYFLFCINLSHLFLPLLSVMSANMRLYDLRKTLFFTAVTHHNGHKLVYFLDFVDHYSGWFSPEYRI